jgi:hypothetical protein
MGRREFIAELGGAALAVCASWFSEGLREAWFLALHRPAVGVHPECDRAILNRK